MKPVKFGNLQITSKLFFTATLLITFLSIGMSSVSGEQKGNSITVDESARSKPIWKEFLKRKPYPYRMPLLPEKRTPIDGVYTKLEIQQGEPVPCRRCPDYLPSGGVWKLYFHQGVYHIFHSLSTWKSIGSFIVAGNQLVLANDPVCHEVIGLYHWRLEKRRLILKVVEDPCKIRLRAKNLTNLPWESCQPPNQEAAITEHWPHPPGCEW